MSADFSSLKGSRSATSRLRAIFDQIENAKAEGASLSSIYEALNKEGTIEKKMSLRTFTVTLSRIRKERTAVKAPTDLIKTDSITVVAQKQSELIEKQTVATASTVLAKVGTNPHELIARVEAVTGQPLKDALKDELIRECEYQAKSGKKFKEEHFDSLCKTVTSSGVDARSLGLSITTSFE